jgi:hypothetical protein
MLDGKDGEDGDAEYGALPDAMEVMIDSIREKLKKTVKKRPMGWPSAQRQTAPRPCCTRRAPWLLT